MVCRATAGCHRPSGSDLPRLESARCDRLPLPVQSRHARGSACRWVPWQAAPGVWLATSDHNLDALRTHECRISGWRKRDSKRWRVVSHVEAWPGRFSGGHRFRGNDGRTKVDQRTVAKPWPSTRFARLRSLDRDRPWPLPRLLRRAAVA